jgi:predicted Rdx family selenoprotein
MDSRALAAVVFDPLLPLPLFAALALLAALAVALSLWRRARGAWLRGFVALVLILALANPRLVQETREGLTDIAVLLVDETASQRVGERRAEAAAARAELERRARGLEALELRTATVPEGGTTGTRLFEALARALAEIPRGRFAGAIAITDGQIHDVPADAPEAIESATGGAPFHLLLTGRPGEIDRRVRVTEAPPFGIVGRSVDVRVIVEDLGGPPASAPVTLTERRDGAAPRRGPVAVGREHVITVPIERAGQTVLEVEVEVRPGEVSLLNNRAVVAINGVRDRLRVLLVSGEPHAGQRTWRRLLKADPNVDLVHFTILRPPEKDDLTPLSELALIAFPVRELFQVKLREFDLIIFDRFANRGILPPIYLRNIADYVRGGGALLMSVGPEFVGPASLSNTALGQVLPASPTGRIAEAPYRARVTALGERHPITAALPGANSGEAEAAWGRWYRRIDTTAPRGQVLMSGPNDEPVLIADRVGAGRVMLLLSDHIWLWSRNHDGGGPQAEILRRVAHWLMREPELEEEDLRVSIDGERLVVERRSIGEGPPPEITVTSPSGAVSTHRLAEAGPGRAIVELPATEPGAWRVSDGTRFAFGAVGAANPLEFADLRATAERASAAAARSGGAVMWLADGVPDLRRVLPERAARGQGWIGLRRNRDHVVTGVADLPLMPPWAALVLILGGAVWAWRREGR